MPAEEEQDHKRRPRAAESLHDNRLFHNSKTGSPASPLILVYAVGDVAETHWSVPHLVGGTDSRDGRR